MSSRVTLSVADVAPQVVHDWIRSGALPALRQRRAGAALADHAAPLPKTVIDRGAYTGSAHGRGCR